MEQTGLISIIMAAYNAEKTIAMAIRSVLAQTYTNWELIVIDDCGKDDTVAVAREFEDPRIRLIHNPCNKGVSYTRQHGVQEAKGEWIAILDSDDAWEPEKLEKQMRLAAKKNANLVFTASKFMSFDGKPIHWVLHAPEEIGYRRLLKQNLVSNSSVLVKKDLYKQHYVMGECMHEDFACWLNILRSGEKAYGIDEPLLIYRLSSTSKSGNKLKAAKMNWNAYRAVGLNIVQSIYYMAWYAVKSLLKYRHLR